MTHNIVTLGKTGTGKSTLINYLLEKNIASTGTGKPVTEPGFHPYDFSIKNFPVRIFDSFGLETGKSDIWLKKLREELKKRSPKVLPKDWFHTVYYCIDAGGARIEDFEINIINKLLEKNYRVLIILTKSDIAADTEISTLTSLLKKSLSKNIPIIPACSEEKILTGGIKTKTFGKEEIKKTTANNFIKAITKRLPDRCMVLIKHRVKIWESKQCIYVHKNTGNFNADEVYGTLTEKAGTFLKELKSKIIPEIIKEEIKANFNISDEIFTGPSGRTQSTISKENIDLDYILSDQYENWNTFLKSLPFIIAATPFIFGAVTILQALTLPMTWFLREPPLNCYKGLTDCYHFQKDNNIIKFCRNLNHFSEEICKNLNLLKPEIEKLIESLTKTASAKKYSAPEISPHSSETNSDELLWKFKTEEPITSGPAIHNGSVYIGSYDGYMYCLDAENGNLKWKFGDEDFLNPIESGPAIKDGFLYFGDGCGNFYCLDTLTGEKIWTFQADLGIMASPFITENFIYLTCSRGKIYCLHIKSGVLKWSYKTEGILIKTAPFVSKGLLYCGSSGRTNLQELFYCLDAETGIKKWDFKTENCICSSPLAVDDRVYFGCCDYKFYCLDSNTGTELWSFQTKDSILSSPAIEGENIYFGSEDKNLYCLDSNTGKLNWSFRTEGGIKSSPCIAGDFVCFGSGDKKIYCLNKKDGSKAKEFQTEGAVISGPIVENGLLYSGSFDGSLYCFDTGVRGIAGRNIFSGKHSLEKTAAVL